MSSDTPSALATEVRRPSQASMKVRIGIAGAATGKIAAAAMPSAAAACTPLIIVPSGTFSESCLKSCGSSVVIWMPVTVGLCSAMRWMISLLTTTPRLWPMKCSCDANKVPPDSVFNSSSEA